LQRSTGNGVDGVDVGPSSPKLVSTSRNPLADISNSKSLRKGCLKKSVSIGLGNAIDLEKMYAPNSISPSPMPGYSRYFSQKVRSFSFFGCFIFILSFYSLFFLLRFFAYFFRLLVQ